MRKIISLFILLLALFACTNSQKTISDYEAINVKFGKSKFTSSNNEFSIFIPMNWIKHENQIDSTTFLYFLESGSRDTSLLAMNIFKMNITSKNIEKEFEHITQKTIKQVSNIQLVEKTTIEIGNINAQAQLLTYKNGEEITQEEIDVFIPINDHQYYFIGIVCDKNEKIETNLAMMMQCVKSFKLKSEPE